MLARNPAKTFLQFILAFRDDVSISAKLPEIEPQLFVDIDKIYYGANQHDAAAVDFDDSFIYRELELEPQNRHKPVENILHDEALAPFNAWREKEDRVEY